MLKPLNENRTGSFLRYVFLLLLAGLVAGCATVDSGELSASDIRRVITGNSLVHEHERTGFIWYFGADGVAVFDPDHGFTESESWEIWRAERKLCWWPIERDLQTCARVELDDDRITLVFDNGDREAYALVAGNQTDPTDDPGENYDPSRELSLYDLQDARIEVPAEKLPASLSGLSGAWYGSWYTFRDYAVVVEQIDADSARVIYAWGPNKWRPDSRAGSRRYTARVDGDALVFGGPEHSFTARLTSGDKLKVVYHDEDWAGFSRAIAWPDPPWESPVAMLQAPDPLAARSELTVGALMFSDEPAANPVHNAFYGPLGASTGPARHAFQGQVQIGDSRVVGRPPGNRDFSELPDFPAVTLDFFSVSDELVPRRRQRLIVDSTGSDWDLIVEPGRTWSEAGDGDWSRAAFPFALVDERGAALRNGLATFVYDAEQMSPIRFQVVKETTGGGDHLDIWGRLQAVYHPGEPAGLQSWINDFQHESASRVNIRPWSELAAEYPDTQLDAFDGKRIRRHISQSGLILDGSVYASECRTRYGPHPYCRQMRHAVFSVTKSLGTWLTSLRMAQKYGAEIMQYRVADYVDLKTDNPLWKEVTFDHALSMVSSLGEVEPTRVSHYVETYPSRSSRDVYAAGTAAQKLAVIERVGFYPWGPGEEFRYAVFDPVILTLAMDELLRRREGEDADLWKMMNREVFQPIGINHLPIRQSLPDAQGRRIPIFGNGSMTRLEDVARIEALIRAGGSHDGQQLLHPQLLQQPFDEQHVVEQGYPTGWISNNGTESLYFRSFWYAHQQSRQGCTVLLPQMSGAGGNSVIIGPNGITTLRFASGPDEDHDNDTWDQTPMNRASDAIRPFCQ